MKKIFLTFTLIAFFGVCTVNAQSDNFFSSPYADDRDGKSNTEVPLMPNVHGSTANETAPIGSGMAILAVCGMAYLGLKRSKE